MDASTPSNDCTGVFANIGTDDDTGMLNEILQ
jgi:hypothetical protein